MSSPVESARELQLMVAMVIMGGGSCGDDG